MYGSWNIENRLFIIKKTYRTRMCIECFDKKVKCEYFNSEFNKT